MEVVEEDFKNVLKTEHPFSLKFFSCFAKLKLKPCDAFFPSFFHRGKGVIFLLLLCFRRNDGWSVGLAAARTDSAQKGPRSEDGAPCCGPEEQSDDRHPTGSHPEEGEGLRTVSPDSESAIQCVAWQSSKDASPYLSDIKDSKYSSDSDSASIHL